MTQEERTKLYIAHSLLDGKMTIKEAAEVSGLSERQWKRIKKGVREQGDAFVIHKNRGRKPQNAVSDELKDRIVTLKNSDKYCKANFSHFQELIGELEAVELSKPTVYRILASSGLASPKKHARKTLHKRRKRKPRRGMLLIADASPYRWFFDEKEFSLHGAIDDATGEIMSLFFTPHECMEGYFELVRDIVTTYGVPLSLYVDRHTIFRSPTAEKLSADDELSGKTFKDTHFGRAMRTLGINLIYAKTPQAKGRIERLWETLQSRLPVELNVSGVKTLEEANAFLKTFIAKYNLKFGVKPDDPKSDFRPFDKKLKLDYILCIKETREADNGSSFCYDGTFYRLVRNGKTMPVIPKAKITVLKSSKIGIKAEYSNMIYDVEALEGKLKKESVAKARVRSEKPRPKPPLPPRTHPWYAYGPRVGTYRDSLLEESDREILDALYSSSTAWR